MLFSWKMLPLRYFLLAVTLWSVASGALQKVLFITRHGDRTTKYPLFPTEINSGFYTNGLGNITDLGRQEGYNLGVRLRNMYQNFLTYDTNEVYANSSGTPLVITTIGCVITGMYRPEDKETCESGTATSRWPVTVNSIPKDDDHVLRAGPVCDQFYLQQQKKPTIRANANYFKENSETIKNLENYTGLEKITNASVVFNVYDNLLVEKIHNLIGQHSWVDGIWPALQTAGYQAFYVPFTTIKARKLAGGPILNEIVQRIQEGDSSPTKVHIYGTAYTIIAPLLMLLGVGNGIPPPYVATVVVELHDNATVRLKYINSTSDPLSLTIPNCDTYCPVDKFVSLTRPFLIKNPAKACMA